MLSTIEKLKTTLCVAADDSSQDALLEQLLTAAEGEFVAYCRRHFALAERTYYPALPEQTQIIKLPVWPVVEVLEIKYSSDYDYDSAEPYVSGEDYRLLDSGNRGWLYRRQGWRAEPDALRIIFVAGYGKIYDGEQLLYSSPVPAELENAALLYAALLHKQPDRAGIKSVVFDGATTAYAEPAIPANIRAVLDRYSLPTL